jgi:hypothetical protein
MNLRAARSFATVLAAVVFAIAAVLAADMSRANVSSSATSTVTTAHIALTGAASETETTQAAVGESFVVTSLLCNSNPQATGKGTIVCTATWAGGTGPFRAVFSADPPLGGGSQVQNDALRRAERRWPCLHNREYAITVTITDRTEAQARASAYTRCNTGTPPA